MDDLSESVWMTPWGFESFERLEAVLSGRVDEVLSQKLIIHETISCELRYGKGRCKCVVWWT